MIVIALIPDDWAAKGLSRNAVPMAADTQRYGYCCFHTIRRVAA